MGHISLASGVAFRADEIPIVSQDESKIQSVGLFFGCLECKDVALLVF
jgi:hypothetical protein